MSQLEKTKSVEQKNDQYNVIFEELKAEMKVTAKSVVAIGKVIQKEGSRKVGSYTWPIWMVQIILEKLLN